MFIDRIDLNKLHTFAAVVDAGGVSAAARRLGLTPSAVSQGLGILEGQLETSLFHRVGRRLVLTREGAILHRRFEDVHRRLSSAIDEVVNAEREVRGTLRVGLYLGFPRDRLADVLTTFAQRHPRASVRVRYEGRGELERGLLDGRLDLTLALDRTGTRPVREIRILRQALVLAAPPTVRRRRLRFQDLGDLSLVDYYPGAPLVHRWIRHHFRRVPPRLQVRVWAASANLALDLALRGVGACVLPESLAESHLAAGRLVRLSGGRSELVDSIWLKALPSALDSPAVRAFHEVAREVLVPGESSAS